MHPEEQDAGTAAVALGHAIDLASEYRLTSYVSEKKTPRGGVSGSQVDTGLSRMDINFADLRIRP